MKRGLKNVGSLLVLSSIFLASPVFAQGGANGSVTLPNPLGGSCTDLVCPLNALINFLYSLAVPICVIMVLVGGFQMVTAAGDPAKFSTGRKTILYAVIGFAVILIAGGVSTLIKNFLSP